MTNSQLDVVSAAQLSVSKTSSWRDMVGVAASVSCAVHCALMPVLIGYLPVLGLEFLADEAFHQWMVLVCLVIALTAFIPGWRKHKRLLPATVGSMGLGLVAFGAFAVADSCCGAAGAAQGGVVTADGSDGVCLDSCCAETELAPCCADSEADTCCADAEADAGSVTTHAGIGTAASAFIAGVLPSSVAKWITPLGGLFLIAGHLLNHRWTCRRDCCSQGNC